MKPRSWYRFANNASEPGVVDLYIYDEIGQSYWDDTAVTASQFKDDLAMLPPDTRQINVHVNSPGGSVFDATAIANMLRAQRQAPLNRIVEISIEGLAASAATIPCMAGTSIRMADNALLMIHNPTDIVWGTAQEMRDSAEALDAVRNTIIATYKWQSPKTEDEIAALMDATTWMDAQQAVDNGFATEIVAGLMPQNRLSRSVMARMPKLPQNVAARVEALFEPEPKTPPQPQALDPVAVARQCREADCGELLEGFLETHATASAVKDGIAAAVASKASARTRVNDITAICAAARVPEFADGYIAGGMSVDQVRAHVLVIGARLDEAAIDGAVPLPGTPTNKRGSVVNTDEIYAARVPAGRGAK